jgi:hypothetical protein
MHVHVHVCDLPGVFPLMDVTCHVFNVRTQEQDMVHVVTLKHNTYYSQAVLHSNQACRSLFLEPSID